MNQTAALIKANGLGAFCAFDGCACSSFSLQGVNVDISCRKSNGGMRAINQGFYGTSLRVWSMSLNVDGSVLSEVAQVVAAYLMESYGSDVMIRYCSQIEDDGCRCIYCSEIRPRTAYLCDACIAGKKWENHAHLEPKLIAASDNE